LRLRRWTDRSIPAVKGRSSRELEAMRLRLLVPTLAWRSRVDQEASAQPAEATPILGADGAIDTLERNL